MQFLKKTSGGIILRNYFEFGPMVQEEMPFKGNSYMELW